MKTLLKITGILLLSWLASGCSPYRYYAIQSNQATFNKYRTFAWLPPVDTIKNPKYNDIVDEKIKTEVTAGLEKRGLLLKSQRPDLLVRYTIAVSDKVKLYNNPVYVYSNHWAYRGTVRYRKGRYFYYSYPVPYTVYVGSEIEQIPYKEGTLIIDLIDRASGKVIWRGYGVGEIDNPETAVNDIPLVTEGILNKLPILPVTNKAASHE